MLKLKKWQLALLILTTFISFIEIFAIVNIIRDSYKLELLNVSDWIGSTSTFCTLIVAIVAFMKAPDWIKQKNYDASHEIIQTVIYSELPRLNGLVGNIKEKIIKRCSDAQRLMLQYDLDFNKFEEKINEIDSCTAEFVIAFGSIQYNINKIRIYNYKCTLHFSESLSRITNDINEIKNYLGYLDSISYDLREHLVVEGNEQDNKVFQEITHMKKDTIIIRKRLHDEIQSLTQSFNPISDYFELNT